MPNPTSIDNLPGHVEADVIERTVTLNVGRSYTVAHDGEDSSGLVNEDTIYCSIEKAVSVDAGPATDKFKVSAGRVVEFGPGAATLNYRSTAGNPTMLIVPGPYQPLIS